MSLKRICEFYWLGVDIAYGSRYSGSMNKTPRTQADLDHLEWEANFNRAFRVLAQIQDSDRGQAKSGWTTMMTEVEEQFPGVSERVAARRAARNLDRKW